MKALKYPGILWGLLFSILIVSPCPGELREWTSSKGTKLTAELVSKTDTELTLRQKSGKKITLRIEQLSEADQQYLKQLDNTADDQDSDGAQKEGRPGAGGRRGALLPVLGQGKGEGCFAYFDGDHYVAKIDSNAMMEIYLKDKAKPDGVLQQWKILVEPIAYKKNRLGTITGHRIVDVIKHGDPVEDPDKVQLTVMIKGDIRCELIYEFSAEGFTTWMKSEHGSDPPEVMNHMMTHRLIGIEHITKDPDDLEKMRLKIESDKYDYLGKYRINTTVSRDDYEVTMPAITSKKIIFDKGSDKLVQLMLWKYTDNALSRGYYVRARKGEYNSSKHAKEKTTITIKGK